MEDKFKFNSIPYEHRQEIKEYIKYGKWFRSEELKKLFMLIDDKEKYPKNISFIDETVSWIMHNAPFGCYGSKEKIENWMYRGGYVGIERAKLSLSVNIGKGILHETKY